MIKVELEGFEEAEKMFEKLGTTGEKYFQQAIKETAMEGASEMKSLLTNSVVTGRLRSSVHYETSKVKSNSFYKDSKGRGFYGAFDLRLGKLTAAFGTNVEYAESVNEYSKKTPRFYEASVKFAENKLQERLRVNYEKAIKELT